MRDVPSAYAQVEMMGLESYFRERAAKSGLVNQFHIAARAMIKNVEVGQTIHELERQCVGRHGDLIGFTKAVQEAQTLDAAWLSVAGQNLSNAFLESVSERSILDLLIRYGLPIPDNLVRVLAASGAVADVVAEGAPIPLVHLNVSGFMPERTTAAALVVLTQELARATGDAAKNLFRRELETATLAASNKGALAQFTSVTPIAATGTAIGDLNAGLAAAEVSTGYVVAASPAAVRELALGANGRMGINGGEYIPGVSIVAVDGDSGDGMKIIPAGGVGVLDEGLVLRETTQASIIMRSDPQADPAMVSLWDTNSLALGISRSFALVHNVSIVEVG